jgi:hypothetical protein
MILLSNDCEIKGETGTTIALVVWEHTKADCFLPKRCVPKIESGPSRETSSALSKTDVIIPSCPSNSTNPSLRCKLRCPPNMIGYILALVPLYIFILLPIQQSFFPHSLSYLTSSSSRAQSPNFIFNESFIAPFENHGEECKKVNFSTYVLSREPLVLYLEGFLHPEEAAHLLEIRSVHLIPHFTLHRSKSYTNDFKVNHCTPPPQPSPITNSAPTPPSASQPSQHHPAHHP